MSRSLLARLLLAAVVCLSVAALVGCTDSARPGADSGQSALSHSAASTTTTASAAATSRPATDAAGSAAGSSSGATTTPKTLSSGEARAIDAELSAIEKELDRISVPSDGAFNSIGAGLK